MTPNAHPDKGGDIEIPEEIKKFIRDKMVKEHIDPLSFSAMPTERVANAMYRHLYPSLKEKEEREGAAKCLMEIAYGEKRGTEALLSEAIEQNRLLIIRVEEKNALLSKGSHDFAALDEIVIEKDKEIEGLKERLHVALLHGNVSDVWQPFNGDYVKQMHDVKLFDGTVIEMCWPNAGIFMACNRTEDNEISLDRVQYVRKNKQFYK